MASDLPKVAHEVAGRPMVAWVIEACAAAGCSRIVVVVGYKREVVEAACAGADAGQASVEFVLQDEQLGTGHAVLCCKETFESECTAPGNEVVVLAGDGPLIRTETLEQLLAEHRASGAKATMATSVIDDPTGYGRIVRDEAGRFQAIVEQKNLDDSQLGIREVNPSYYCFDTRALFDALERVERNPVSGEYYVTDVPALLLGAGEGVGVIEAVPPEDVLSINTLEQLSEVDRVLRERLTGAGAAGDGTESGGQTGGQA